MKKHINIKSMITVVLVVIIALFGLLNIKTDEKTNKLEVVLFYTPTCPYCKVAMKFLDRVKDNYKDVTFTNLNAATAEGANQYRKHQSRLNIPSNGVPLAVFGDQYELGFGDESGKIYTQKIEEMIQKSKTQK